VSAPVAESGDAAGRPSSGRFASNAALFGALFGLLGIVVGGVIAAASSYYTTKVQVDSQAAQSRQQFLRTEQQAAYSKLAGDEAVNRTVFIRCSSRLQQPDYSIDESGYASLQDQMESVRNEVVADAARVYVVGSAQTSNLAFKIFSDFKVMIARCVAGAAHRLQGADGSADDAHTLDVAISAERRDLSLFLIAGRNDLHS
jgi:hypothetical protein